MSRRLGGTLSPRLPVITPTMFGAIGDGLHDDTGAIRAMLVWARDEGYRGLVDWSAGLHYVTDTIRIEGTGLRVRCGTLVFDSRFQRGGTVLEVAAHRAHLAGRLVVRATMPLLRDRTAHVGVWVRALNAGVIDAIEVSGTVRAGVVLEDCIAARVGPIEVTDCGSTSRGAAQLHRDTVSWTDREDAGQGTSVVQSSTITLDAPPLHDPAVADLVNIAGEPHQITSYDPDTRTMVLYPRIRPLDLQSGTVTLLYGVAVDVIGGDTTGLRVGPIDVIRAGVGCGLRSLYGAQVDGMVVQAAGVGLQLGAAGGSAMLGATVDGLHLEANDLDIVKVSRPVEAQIVGTPTLSFVKSRALGPTLDDGQVHQEWGSMQGVVLDRGGARYAPALSLPRNGAILRLATTPGRDRGTVRADNPTLTLTHDEEGGRLWGADTIRVTLVGLDWGAPGTVTLRPTDPTWRVGTRPAGEDGTLVADAVIDLTLIADVANKTWRVLTAPLASRSLAG